MKKVSVYDPYLIGRVVRAVLCPRPILALLLHFI